MGYFDTLRLYEEFLKEQNKENSLGFVVQGVVNEKQLFTTYAQRKAIAARTPQGGASEAEAKAAAEIAKKKAAGIGQKNIEYNLTEPATGYFDITKDLKSEFDKIFPDTAVKLKKVHGYNDEQIKGYEKLFMDLIRGLYLEVREDVIAAVKKNDAG